MRSAYPVVFYPAEEGGYVVATPDIDSCWTQGDDLPEAMEMAKDAIEGMLVYYEDEGKEIPKPSTMEDAKKIAASYDMEFVTENPIFSYVAINTDEWRRNNNDKSVRKNVTIPEWLNKKAEKANVNFSQILQNALMQYLDLA